MAADLDAQIAEPSGPGGQQQTPRNRRRQVAPALDVDNDVALVQRQDQMCERAGAAHPFGQHRRNRSITARTWRVGALIASRTCAAVSGAIALAGAASRAHADTSTHARTTDRTLIGTSVENGGPSSGVVRAAGLHSGNSPGLDGAMAAGLELCGRGTRGTD